MIETTIHYERFVCKALEMRSVVCNNITCTEEVINVFMGKGWLLSSCQGEVPLLALLARFISSIRIGNFIWSSLDPTTHLLIHTEIFTDYFLYILDSGLSKSKDVQKGFQWKMERD